MSLQDPIADMLTRVRNAQAIGLPKVSMPASTLKAAVAGVLQSEGYIVEYNVEGEKAEKKLHIKLKYYEGKSVIDKLQRVSKPSLRVYKGKDELPKVMNGLGVAIISTPKGVMSDRQARSLGVGGEVICYVS